MSSSEPTEIAASGTEPDGIDPGEFRRVLGNFPTGVTIVTGNAGDGTPVGLVVGSFFSVSLDPPLVGFCVGTTSSSWSAMRDGGVFCVNVLGDDQAELSGQFAGKGDKFAGVSVSPSPVTGTPDLDGCLATLDCRVESISPAGDHEVVIGRVVHLRVDRPDAQPLLFFRGGYGTHLALGS